MSEIEAFFKKVESDNDLQAKLEKVSLESEMEAIRKVVDIAKAAGYNITQEELSKIRAERVTFFPGVAEMRTRGKQGKWCCHWAQGCMPGFSGK